MIRGDRTFQTRLSLRCCQVFQYYLCSRFSNTESTAKIFGRSFSIIGYYNVVKFYLYVYLWHYNIRNTRCLPVCLFTCVFACLLASLHCLKLLVRSSCVSVDDEELIKSFGSHQLLGHVRSLSVLVYHKRPQPFTAVACLNWYRHGRPQALAKEGAVAPPENAWTLFGGSKWFI